MTKAISADRGKGLLVADNKLKSTEYVTYDGVQAFRKSDGRPAGSVSDHQMTDLRCWVRFECKRCRRGGDAQLAVIQDGRACPRCGDTLEQVGQPYKLGANDGR
jgi:hypothetical protein